LCISAIFATADCFNLAFVLQDFNKSIHHKLISHPHEVILYESESLPCQDVTHTAAAHTWQRLRQDAETEPRAKLIGVVRTWDAVEQSCERVWCRSWDTALLTTYKS